MMKTEAPPRRRNFLVSIFLFLWNAITWIRRLVLNLLFIAVVLIIFAAVSPKLDEPIPNQAPLVIAPSGMLVDQLTYASPESQLLNVGQNQPQETLVRDLVRVIEFASNDSRISGLILKLDYLRGGGLSKIQEIGRAIDKFKSSGKPVIASADNYSQTQYFLASYADEIFINDMGHIALQGFGIYRNYYKEALDKLSVRFHVFKVGDYKDFVEPYIRNEMSDLSKQHNKIWLDELWGTYTDHIEERRDLKDGRLTGFVNHMADQLATTEGDAAQMAFEMNLVDRVGSRVDHKKHLIERFGSDHKDGNLLRQVSYGQYSKQALSGVHSNQGNIGLIVARGNILDGHQPEGAIGGDSLSQLIRDARSDDNLQALVLRIDSGGGSAFASEIIRRELQETRDAGIPVVVSMGSVAASGGYWIATASDEVWSTPTTITGSIGVFGLFPTFEESLNRLGVHSDGIGTTNLAGATRPDRPLSKDAENILQQGVESIYTRFLKLVADSRNTTPDEIHKVAGGRVWTGAKAKELGLIDNLGYLDDAISSAASRANIQNIRVRLIERKLSPKEQLLKELFKESKVNSAVQSGLGAFFDIDNPTMTMLKQLLNDGKNTLQLGSAPRSAYALCMDCYAP